MCIAPSPRWSVIRTTPIILDNDIICYYLINNKNNIAQWHKIEDLYILSTEPLIKFKNWWLNKSYNWALPSACKQGQILIKKGNKVNLINGFLAISKESINNLK